MLRGSTPPTTHPPPPASLHLFCLSIFLSISHPLRFTGAALEREMDREAERWRDERKRGIYNRMEQCYLSLSPPSLHPLQAPHNTQNKAHEKEVQGMKIEEEGGSVFFHPFNNRGMISAYPLITCLFFALLHPLCHLSLSATPFFSSSGKGKSSLFLTPASLFCCLSICLSFQSSLHPSLLSRERIQLYSIDLLLCLSLAAHFFNNFIVYCVFSFQS